MITDTSFFAPRSHSGRFSFGNVPILSMASSNCGTPTGLSVPIEEFRGALRSFPRSAILIACARFSAIFKFGPAANTVASKEDTVYWIPHLIRPDLVNRALKAANDDRPIFFQGQLRFLASEAMRLDPAPPEDGSQVPDIALVALLLGAGELRYKKHESNLPDDLDVMANLVADSLPTFEIGSITDPYMLFLRFYIYLTVIIPRLPKHLQKFDVYAEFEKVFGFPLKLYYQFVNAFSIHAMNERLFRQSPAGRVDVLHHQEQRHQCEHLHRLGGSRSQAGHQQHAKDAGAGPLF